MRLRQRAIEDLWRRPPGHFDSLDGMRGFASVIVQVYHCGLWTGLFAANAPAPPGMGGVRALLNGFWTGIDIFYVLSGFLIGRILFLELVGDGFIHYRKFLIRRTFRIFPAYYFVITLSLFVIARSNVGLFPFLFSMGDWQVLRANAWANYTYLSNYFYPGSAPNIMSWGWSLCVEEHFYLILPPLLWAIFRFAPARNRPWLLLGCVALPLGGRAVQYGWNPSINLLDGFYYYSHNRFDEIFVGVLIAYLHVVHQDGAWRWAHRLRHVLWVAGVVCAASVWIAGGLWRGGQFTVVWQFILMAVAAGLFVVNGLYLDNRATRFFAHPLWYPLSRVSYGSYLIHPFVLFALLSVHFALTGRLIVGVWPFAVFCVAVLTISNGLAAVMFMALERSMLDSGIRLGREWDTTRRRDALFSLDGPPPPAVDVPQQTAAERFTSALESGTSASTARPR